MKLLLQRFFQTSDSTIGGLFFIEEDKEPKYECLTLEDLHRDVKIYSETRIPAGIYKIKLQTEGRMTSEYTRKFPGVHKGMLWLQDVPGFTTIYIHIGNKDEDTKGCILVGKNYIDGEIKNSTVVYTWLYSKIADFALKGELEIEIKDESWI